MDKKPTLNSLNPLLSLLPSALPDAPMKQHAQPWRHWYQTAAWQRTREHVFIRDHCCCFECGHVFDKPSLVAHHRKPHQGNAALFWNLDNLVTCCKSCHDSIVQARELEAKAKGQFFG